LTRAASHPAERGLPGQLRDTVNRQRDMAALDILGTSRSQSSASHD